MVNTIIDVFGDRNNQEYIEIIISFIEIVITMLSLITVFFNINYENNIIKLRNIIWEIKNLSDMEEINKKIFEYYTIEKNRIKIYDKMIYFFRVINILVIFVILIILVVKVSIVDTLGEIILLYMMTGVVISTIIFIIDVFKTSKENKDIYTYEKLINLDNCEKIFKKGIEIVPKIKIFVSSHDGEFEIEYCYPIKNCYNINAGFCIKDRFYCSLKYTTVNISFEGEERINQKFMDKEVNKFLYTNLMNESKIMIKAKVITKNTKTEIIYDAIVNTTEDGIMVETADYRIEQINSSVLDNCMKKDGYDLFNQNSK